MFPPCPSFSSLPSVDELLSKKCLASPVVGPKSGIARKMAMDVYADEDCTSRGRIALVHPQQGWKMSGRRWPELDFQVSLLHTMAPSAGALAKSTSWYVAHRRFSRAGNVGWSWVVSPQASRVAPLCSEH